MMVTAQQLAGLMPDARELLSEEPPGLRLLCYFSCTLDQGQPVFGVSSC